MKKERINFYHLVSVKSGLEVEVVKRVYFAMIKVIVEELKNWGEILLPELGRFSIIIYSGRKIRDVNTREVKQTLPVRVLKFAPWYTIKDYIKGLDAKK
jgi:nucleoid DNA-binding protein